MMLTVSCPPWTHRCVLYPIHWILYWPSSVWSRWLNTVGMAQWWECSLPTNASRVRFLDPASRVGWVCGWFCTLLREVFPGYFGFPLSSKTNISKFQFDLDYCQALYHEPLARVIAQALPVFDIKLACTFFLHLRDFGCHPGDRELYSLNRVSHHSQILVVDWEPEQMFHPCSSSTIPSWCPMFDEWKIREISPKQYTLRSNCRIPCHFILGVSFEVAGYSAVKPNPNTRITDRIV